MPKSEKNGTTFAEKFLLVLVLLIALGVMWVSGAPQDMLEKIITLL